MDPVTNPYAPGAGTQPPELAGRATLLEQARIAIERIRVGRPAKSFIAVGLRGVGKTVLLNRVSDAAQARDYRVCMIEAHEQKALPELLVPALRRIILDLDRMGALADKAKRALRVLKSFMSHLTLRYADAELSLDIDAEAGAADSGDLEADLAVLFVALGEAARVRGVAVAIIIDEIQYLSNRDLGALIMAMHRVVQTGLPLLLVAAGLPQVVGLTGRSKSYAERLFDFPIVDALSDAEATDALALPAAQQGVTWQPAALGQVRELTRGYPYFLQEWGYHTWNVATEGGIHVADVQAATTIAIKRLDEGFFRVRFDRLTPREKDYLRAMAELDPASLRAGEIADRLGIKAASVAPLRSGLIGKGMIYSPQHGETAFTVPLFDDFLRRIMPGWRSPYQARR
jgi:hypothetical protein